MKSKLNSNKIIKVVKIHISEFYKKKNSGVYSIIVLLLILIPTVYLTANNLSIRHIASAATNTVNVSVNLASPTTVSNFLPGATFIQTDTNFSSSTEEQQLGVAVGYLNTQIMGWGNGNPEPSPGQYDWSTLDPRIAAMQAAGVTGMITFCCSPDWMKGGQAGQTNWNNLNVAPVPAHYQDFANLAAAVAQRYPSIKYFQVWNELKGFYNNNGGFNITGYMQLYNDVYSAVKAVRPDALIGGPYIGMDGIGTNTNAVVSQWLNTKTGGDFIAVDGGFDSTSATNDFDGASFYTGFSTWLRQQPNGGATLPFGWAEWYPGTVQNWNDLNHFNATMTNAMIYTIDSGASYALTWGVEGGLEGVNKEGAGQEEGLISGGQLTPFYYSLQDFKTYFGPGTQLYNSSVSQSDTVSVLASQKKTMLVNQTNTSLTANVNGTLVSLTPYQVDVINTPQSNSLSPIPTSQPTVTSLPTVAQISPTTLPKPTAVATPTQIMLPTPTPISSGSNLFQNPSFEINGNSWLSPWYFSVKGGAGTIAHDCTTAANGLCSAKITVTKKSTDYNIQLLQGSLKVAAGKKYTLTFWAKGSNNLTIRPDLQQSVSPYSTYFTQSFTVNTTWQQYTTTFTQPSSNSSALFDFNVASATGTIWIDNVSLQ